MHAKRIIPCLDVKNGRVVKGVNFQNLRDAGDPATHASFYSDEGADEIVFLDITATLEGRRTMHRVLEETAKQVFIPLTVGGGVSCLDDVRDLLRAGADKVSINTAAVLDPGLIERASSRFGSQCIVIAIDAKKTGLSGKTVWEVHINAGTKATGRDAVAWAREAERMGAGEILLTSMDFDGTKDGYDIELTRQVSQAVGIPVIASGGAGKMEHFFQALTEGRADAVLAASVFHYRTFTVRSVKQYLAEKGVAVRI